MKTLQALFAGIPELRYIDEAKQSSTDFSATNDLPWEIFK